MSGRGSIAPGGIEKVKKATATKKASDNQATTPANANATNTTRLSQSEPNNSYTIDADGVVTEASPRNGLVVNDSNAGFASRVHLKNGTSVMAYDPQEINHMSEYLFGYSLASEDYAAIVAAPANSTVTVKHLNEPGYNRQGISIRVEHEHYKIQRRELYINSKGELELHHNIWQLKTGAPKGTGTKVFLNVVNAAIKYKIDKITTEAAGDPESALADRNGWNGYYTWPRFGYNGHLSSSIQQKLPAELKGVTTLCQLFLKEGGAEWWKANGEEGNLTFTVAPSSSSLKVLRQYLKEKKLKQDQETKRKA